VPEAFARFWQAYPRKVGKAAALAAWRKRKPPLDAVLAALVWQTKGEQWTRDGGQYVPNPATYLNQGRWEDEPTTVRPTRKLNLIQAPADWRRSGTNDGG